MIDLKSAIVNGNKKSEAEASLLKFVRGII